MVDFIIMLCRMRNREKYCMPRGGKTMRQWLDKLDQKMNQFMWGRNGQDSLNAALCVLALLLFAGGGKGAESR